MNNRQLLIPVILGTVRKERASENVAKFVLSEVQKREGVRTELIDIRDLNFPIDDAGEQIKDAKFSAVCERADGFVIVAPEYNHGYPGMLKHVLDSNLKDVKRLDKFLRELIWMSSVLRYGRENVSIEG